MASPTSSDRTYNTTGVKDWVPLNGTTGNSLTIGVEIDATATATVEVALSNPAKSPVAYPVDGFTAITATTNGVVDDTPLKAVRINIAATTGDVRFTILQSGD